MSTVIKGSGSGQINLNDTTGSIQLNGSDVLTIDSSGNLTAPNNITANTIIPTSSSAPTNGMFLPTTNTVGVSTNSTERMRINSSGCVTINTTAVPTVTYGVAKFVVGNSAGSAYGTITDGGIYEGTSASTASQPVAFWRNPNGIVGSINTSGTSTSYATSSDYRLKENVAPMSGSIDRLKQLKPSTWTWIHGGNGEGFLAHEAQEVVPESVTGTKDEVNDEGNPVYQGIDQSKLVPLLTAALQEAITKIEDLETRIQTLEAE